MTKVNPYTKTGTKLLSIEDEIGYTTTANSSKTGRIELAKADNGTLFFRETGKMVDDVLSADEILKLRANSSAHTIERHGFEVTDDLLKRRATEGIAPDGSSIAKRQGGKRIGNVIPPMSSKFKDAASMKKALNAVDESTEVFQEALSTERLAKGTKTPSQFKFQVNLGENIGFGYKRPLDTPNYVLTGKKLSGEPIKIERLTKIEVRYKLNENTNKYEINTMFPIE